MLKLLCYGWEGHWEWAPSISFWELCPYISIVDPAVNRKFVKWRLLRCNGDKLFIQKLWCKLFFHTMQCISSIILEADDQEYVMLRVCLWMFSKTVFKFFQENFVWELMKNSFLSLFSMKVLCIYAQCKFF